ncbi:MAG: MFS transporter [Nocardioidaceae bacterium]
MHFAAALRHLLTRRRFRQLFAVRVTSQASDGIFQVALASYVLFSPERQPDAASIAEALAAVLLPFSLLGPFAGVFLDRWSRRQVLLVANLVRLIPVLAVAALVATDVDGPALFVMILAAFSINRFFLAALSAALPHVVAREELVLANSITPTSGTIAFMLGLGAASAFRALTPGNVDTLVVVIAALGYLTAALLALRLPRLLLGPHFDASMSDVKKQLRHVVSGLMDGVRHLHERPAAAHALAVIAMHRFCYGLSTVATILLYRNYFHDPADTDAGLAGLSIAILVSGIGFLLAAVLTPVVSTRLTPPRWIVVLLAAAALVEVFPGGLYTEPALLVAALVLGLSAQGVKICVDTIVQTTVEDAYRGRVFSLYDVLFNVVFVAAAAVGVLIVPTSGKSYLALSVIAAGYAVTAIAYARTRSVRHPEAITAAALDEVPD